MRTGLPKGDDSAPALRRSAAWIPHCFRLLRVNLITGLAAIYILPLASIHGQNIAGAIVGQVTDPSGSVVPDAEITVRNEGVGFAGSPREIGGYE